MKIEDKFKKANELHIKGNVRQALVIYLEIYKSLKNRVDIIEHLIGVSYYQLKDLVNAKIFLENAIEINNKNADYLSNLGLVLRDLNLPNKAIEIFEKSLKINPTHIDALNGLGTVYAKLKDWENALLYTQKSFYIKNNVDNTSNLALYYLSLGSLIESEKYNNISITLFGENVNNLNIKARILHANGKHNESILIYEKLLNNYPKNDEIRINAANIALIVDSLDLVEKFIRGISPEITDKKLFEARLLFHKKQVGPAIMKAIDLIKDVALRSDNKILGSIQEVNSIDFSKSDILLKDIDSILMENQCDYFIAFGTLLGIVRESDILKHDKDLDIGVLNIADLRNIRKKIIDSGKFILSERSHFQNNNALFSVVHKESKLTLDIFNFINKSNKLLATLDLNLEFEWVFEPVIIERINFKNININSIKDPQIFLRQIYGDNWKIPDPFFDSVVEGLNLSERSKNVSIYYSLMRLYKAMLLKNENKVKYYMSILKDKFNMDL